MTTLEGRDLAIVQLVARFKQLSSHHVYSAIFYPSTSRTPCDRALRRLTDQKYLARIERRMVGGTRGGSGQYVYQLGRRGFFLNGTGRYSPARAVNYHSLAIGDCYLALRQLQREGVLRIVGLSTEPDAWKEIGGVGLRPDMYFEVEKPATGARLQVFLEVDLGTEAQRQLRGKLESYVRAYNEADVTAWPVFPLTCWAVVDPERETEMRWIISQMPKDAQGLFAVCTISALGDYFSR